MTNIYHATPYDISAAGFYFSSYEDYLEKAAKHCNDYGEPVEEYEIQFIDGENSRLFQCIGVHQANLKLWFERFENIKGEELIKFIYALEGLGYDPEDALEKLDDICLFEGIAIEYAESYIDDCGLLDTMPENLRYYFDTEKFARDMLLNGDITEFRFDGKSYIAT